MIDRMDSIVRFLFEIGSLKLIPRSGWFKIGIKNPESVAEHCFRTAIIASIIAFFETGDIDKAFKACFFGLIHDLGESRTLDLHRLSRRYVEIRRDALSDQLDMLPDEFKKVRTDDVMDFVRDADKIELLLQAKEYSETYPSAMEYTKSLNFKTKTAKILAEKIRKSDHRWWLRLE